MTLTRLLLLAGRVAVLEVVRVRKGRLGLSGQTLLAADRGGTAEVRLLN